MTRAWLIDTSAFMKLVHVERYSDAMANWFREDEHVACDLLRTEARRAASGDDVALTAADELLAELPMLALTPDLLDRAGRMEGDLRSLDAIHVTAALELGADLGGIVTYDRRMGRAAEALGITVVAPGVPDLAPALTEDADARGTDGGEAEDADR